MNIDSIIKYFSVIIPIIISFALVFLTHKYWIESKRTAKVQLFVALSNILDNSNEALSKKMHLIEKGVLPNDNFFVEFLFKSIISDMEQSKSLFLVYRKIVADIDSIYKLDGSLMRAINNTNINYNIEDFKKDLLYLTEQYSKALVNSNLDNSKINELLDSYTKFIASIVKG